MKEFNLSEKIRYSHEVSKYFRFKEESKGINNIKI